MQIEMLNLDAKILEKALKEMGYETAISEKNGVTTVGFSGGQNRGTYVKGKTAKSGKLTVQGKEINKPDLLDSYAAQMVKKNAAKYALQGVKMTKVGKYQYQFQL